MPALAMRQLFILYKIKFIPLAIIVCFYPAWFFFRQHSHPNVIQKKNLLFRFYLCYIVRVKLCGYAPLPEYGALEARQEKILGQLAELKKQVSTLCHFLKQSNQIETTKDLVAVKKPVHAKIVLHVNPCKPPYSILALQQLWKDTRIRVSSYLHSTATAPIPLIFSDTPISDIRSNVLELTLIWKDVPQMEFIMDKDSFHIMGEVNFLRYVSRLIESHGYEKTYSQAYKIDFALDCVYVLYLEKCIKKGLHKLANTFETWSCNGHGEFNIADIAVWSLIKQFAETSLPPALKKWYALCEEAFIVENLTR